MKAYTGSEPFIFISYAHADRDIVFPIIELLQNNGYHVWYDEGLQYGNDWRDELEERIRCCHSFIFMQSARSVRSEYCKDEIYTADSEKKKRTRESDGDEDRMPFLTIKLEESEVTGGLRMILDSKQGVSGIDISAKEITQKLISSNKLETCRDQFRYIEGVNWGPARDGYYFDERPDHPVFNSIIDNPSYGDERHFLSIEGPSHITGDHLITVIPWNSYTVRILYCNDGKPESNDSGIGYAQKAKVAVKLPEKLSANKLEILQANISTTTGEHKDTWDQVALCCKEDVSIEYVIASMKIFNYGKLNGTILSRDLFTTGDYIGYNKLSGVIPAGMQYSGVIKFQIYVKPVQKVTFEHTVSVDRRNYSDRVSVLPGDILTFRNTIKNDHFGVITDVTFRDELPEGLELIPDSTMLYAIPKIEGRKLSNNIASNGINTGRFGKDISGVLQYKVLVRKDIPVACELVSKSFLCYTPAIYNSKEQRYITVGEAVKMYSETTCYVKV